MRRQSGLAPARILPRYTHDQSFDLRADLRSPHTARFRSVELMRNQFPIPAKDRLGLNDIRHIGQYFSPEPVTNLCQGFPLQVRQAQAPFQLIHQHTVLGSQIFVSQQQLLIHRSSDVGQYLSPIHRCPANAPQ